MQSIEQLLATKKTQLAEALEAVRTLERQVQSLEDTLAMISKPLDDPKANRITSGKRGLTVKDAVMRVLTGENQNMTQVMAAILEVRGETNKQAVAQAIMQLRKANQIVSDVKGIYKLAYVVKRRQTITVKPPDPFDPFSIPQFGVAPSDQARSPNQATSPFHAQD